MIGRLLFLFVALVLTEVLILIKMGETFGFFTTVLTVIGTGFVGAFVARLEGFRVWNSIAEDFRQRRMPAEKMLDAFLLLVAGLFLILPGLLTDIAGILLLLPWTRFAFKRWLRKKFDAYRGGPGGAAYRIDRL